MAVVECVFPCLRVVETKFKAVRGSVSGEAWGNPCVVRLCKVPS